jgi:transposase, IS5 family
MGKVGRSSYGPQGYSPVGLLKALILQAWHNLSDEALEEALRVRLDFMIITDLDPVPDHTTLCRFRNRLTQLGLWDTLLAEVNDQLEDKGLKVKESQGAIIDATIIESAARPHRELTAIAVDHREDMTSYEVEEKETLSKDPDATWLKKGKRSYYGYKGFMIAGQEDGYIDQIYVTPAHLSEVSEFKKIIHNRKDKRMYGDKGYASKENKNLLRTKGIKNGFMEKATKTHPLTSWQKRFNRMIAKVRYRIEQGFGTLLSRASYFTLHKVHGQMALKAITFNLLKGLNKASLMQIEPKIRLI